MSDDLPSALTALDRPNSYIGRAVPRPNLGPVEVKTRLLRTIGAAGART